MYRFFEESKFQDSINLSPKNSHHFLKVLRIGEREKVEVCANNGIFLAELQGVEENIVILKKISEVEPKNESKIKVTLFQAILKGDKMDQALKQATEVGVAEIYPLILKRNVANIEQKSDKKIQRWQKVVEAAAKQSKRDFIPKVNSPINLKNLIDNFKMKDLIVPYESEENKTLYDLKNLSSDIALIIGSEGGFEESEIELLKANGANIITLGNRILRAETATVCSSFSIIYYLESR